ncbi:response regulator transcription factor [bacterium]|nr:MAG: response regulator transcription factor [bacterium]
MPPATGSRHEARERRGNELRYRCRVLQTLRQYDLSFLAYIGSRPLRAVRRRPTHRQRIARFLKAANATVVDIVVYSDSPLVCVGLEHALHPYGTFRFLGCSGNCRANSLQVCADLARATHPVLLAADLNGSRLYDGDFCAGLNLLRTANPAAPVLLIAVGLRAAEVLKSFGDGIRGVCGAGVAPADLADGIRAIMTGRHWLDPTLVHALCGSDGDCADDEPKSALAATLTPRQRQVLSLLGAGLRNSEIAQHLGCSAATVKAHIAEIFRRLDVTNRTQAIHRFLENVPAQSART